MQESSHKKLLHKSWEHSIAMLWIAEVQVYSSNVFRQHNWAIDFMHINENRFKGGGGYILSLSPSPPPHFTVRVAYILVSTVKVFDVTFVNTQAPFFGALMMVQALK